MKSIGIIAEYNPFHNGHLYQINKIKEKYKDYKIILVMVGNFTQRGEPTIIDKWKRTKIAIENGIDLVVELPFPFATQSSDYFAYGAVTILEKLKVDKLIFGTESDTIEDIETIAKTQSNNRDFSLLVSYYSKQGNNYPTSLSLALKDLTGIKIDMPNDILGISYIKTILNNNYNIKYESIKRTNDYKNSIDSGTKIRENLKDKKDISKYVPKNTLDNLTNLHFIDDYFPLLKYKITTEKDLSIYQTVDEGIEYSLKKEIIKTNNYKELIESIKSKRYTYNKISRMLLHILCNFTKDKAKEYNDIKYIRILGFNNNGRKYLNGIKKDIDVPIISKINREKDSMLEYEINTTCIYDLPYNNNLLEKEIKNNIIMED